jgi:hypothetical protein
MPKATSQALWYPKYLRIFADYVLGLAGLNSFAAENEIAYRKQNINSIHNAKNKIPDFCLIVTVTRKDEGAGNNVMREHLPMILSPFLNIHNHDLL